MTKSALSVVAAIFGLCVSVSAQESTTGALQAPSFTLAKVSPSAMVKGRAALGQAGAFRSLNNAWFGRGPLTLLDGRTFSFPGTFGWVEATPGAFLPAFTAEELPPVTPQTTLARSTPNEKPGLFKRPDYVGGEVGVLVGRGTGKYGRDVEQGYFISEIIEGDTHITVGASYERSSGKVTRTIGR